MDKEMKRTRRRARLIALGVALVTLTAATGFALWQYRQFTAAYLPFDVTAVMIVNGVGAVILYLLVVHYLKKPHQ